MTQKNAPHAETQSKVRLVVQVIGGEEKHFCCPGCARTYQQAYETDMLDKVVTRTEKNTHSEDFSNGRIPLHDRRNVVRRFPQLPNRFSRYLGVKSAALALLQSADAFNITLNWSTRKRSSKTWTASVIMPGGRRQGRERSRTQAGRHAALNDHRRGSAMGIMLLTCQKFITCTRRDSLRMRMCAIFDIWPHSGDTVISVGGISFLKALWCSTRSTATMDPRGIGNSFAYSYSVDVTSSGSGEAYPDRSR